MKNILCFVFFGFLGTLQCGCGMINEIAHDQERLILFQPSDDEMAILEAELAVEGD